jgi:hypothetical protein
MFSFVKLAAQDLLFNVCHSERHGVAEEPAPPRPIVSP